MHLSGRIGAFCFRGELMENRKYKRDDALLLLKNKAAELGRLPKRADFAEAELVAIKAFLGPMPRALEAAGLKEPPAMGTLERNRIRRKRKKAEMKAKKQIYKSKEI